MSKSRKLECMKDVVDLALAVGQVNMKQCVLNDGSQHTTFACRIPRDTYPDVEAEVTDISPGAAANLTTGVWLEEQVARYHSVAVIAWPGG
jgi:hypothetical protein